MRVKQIIIVNNNNESFNQSKASCLFSSKMWENHDFRFFGRLRFELRAISHQPIKIQTFFLDLLSRPSSSISTNQRADLGTR